MALVVVRRGGTMRVTWPQLASCVLVGRLLPGANAVLFYAEQDTPIGLASLIIASIPLWVVVLRLVLGERVPTMVLVGRRRRLRRRRRSAAAGRSGGATAGVLLCLRLRGDVVGRLGRLAPAADAGRTRSPRRPGRCSPAGS